MPFPTFAVANEFLDIAEEAGAQVDPMKLQKLVYYAHGWHLGLGKGPLINEMIEAWKWGPVIRTLYYQFRAFGRSPITRRASESELVGSKLTQREPRLKDVEANSSFAVALVRRVWELYGGYSSIQLSNMTHAASGPWQETVSHHPLPIPIGLDIPNETIEGYFRERARR